MLEPLPRSWLRLPLQDWEAISASNFQVYHSALNTLTLTKAPINPLITVESQ